MIPLVLVAALLSADPATSDEKFAIYKVPDGAVMTVGDSKVPLPEGYFLPKESYNQWNNEMKALQTAAETPAPVEIDIGVKGWLIGAAIFVGVGVATGFAVAKLTSK